MYIMLYIVVGVAVLILILALVAPKTYEVNRTIEIAKPRQEVFEYLKSLKKMDEWSPWAKKDPNMEKKFMGNDGEVGCTNYWKGNKEVGEGEQEVVRMVDGERIESELRFLKPFKSTSDCYLQLDDTTDGNTSVTWGFSGNHKFPMNIMMIFMSMDKAVGKDFEEGLQNIKTNLEA